MTEKVRFWTSFGRSGNAASPYVVRVFCNACRREIATHETGPKGASAEGRLRIAAQAVSRHDCPVVPSSPPSSSKESS